MRRKVRLAACLCALVLLTGCAAPAQTTGPQRYEATFLDVFDTVTTVVGFADSEESFRAAAEQLKENLMYYHRLFDIYNDYDGLNNIKTVNDNAGIAPVEVEKPIMELLTFCREMYRETDGAVNVGMGSVLKLWHNARTDGLDDPAHAAPPAGDKLCDAAAYTDLDALVIDEEASTVYLPDAHMSLDVGAVAKGWAVERVCGAMDAPMLISVGGNVRATGGKPDGTAWVAGIQNPDGGEFLRLVYADEVSIVTSGDYQRYFVGADGTLYHHIIDPGTLYPAAYWRSVTVLCGDSGIADALSTALFTMDREAGQALLERYDAAALWMDLDGRLVGSHSFEKYVER